MAVSTAQITCMCTTRVNRPTAASTPPSIRRPFARGCGCESGHRRASARWNPDSPVIGRAPGCSSHKTLRTGRSLRSDMTSHDMNAVVHGELLAMRFRLLRRSMQKVLQWTPIALGSLAAMALADFHQQGMVLIEQRSVRRKSTLKLPLHSHHRESRDAAAIGAGHTHQRRIPDDSRRKVVWRRPSRARCRESKADDCEPTMSGPKGVGATNRHIPR